MPRLHVVHRTVAILVLISLGPVVCAALLGLIPIDESRRLADEARVTRSLAAVAGVGVQRDDFKELIASAAKYSDDEIAVHSIRLIRFDGRELASFGEHHRQWDLAEGMPSELGKFRVSIQRNGRDWAELQICFAQPKWYATAIGKLSLILLAVAIMNLLGFWTFLSKMLSVLDPKNAVPKRVKNTLNTMAGGVVVLDAQQKIIMANDAFQTCAGLSLDQLVGTKLNRLDWVTEEGELLPWESNENDRRGRNGVKIQLRTLQTTFFFVVNASSIANADEKVAGTLVSFEDVTRMESQRQELLTTLSELQETRAEIEAKNVALTELATKDGLTGTYNRRAFFEILEQAWMEACANKHCMSVVMLDIDHFKSLNDNFGHAVGDTVLKDVVRVISAALKDGEQVGRYGGEEFCVLIPTGEADHGSQRAELIRLAIERELKEPYAVTSSVGLASKTIETTSVQHMLGLADNALYYSKRNGRNRVTAWTPHVDKFLAATTKAEERIDPRKATKGTETSIPYHAVVSLHAALAYRHADTAVHSQRVAELAVSLGRGLMSVTDLYILEMGALLHDIGKIGIPDNVLLKPGKLTEDEWKRMETHDEIGVSICEAAFNCQTLTDILKFHHCRYDGERQCASLPKGKDIPIGARIVSIVDAYDAMVCDRVYRKGRAPEEAFAELQRCAGGQFDPDLVEKFVSNQVGWRPDSRFMLDSSETAPLVGLGYQLERLIQAYDSGDQARLEIHASLLQEEAIKMENHPIAMLAHEIKNAVSAPTTTDLNGILPMVQEVVDLGLISQRAHLRNIGSHAKSIEHSSAGEFLLENEQRDSN